MKGEKGKMAESGKVMSEKAKSYFKEGLN